jgi:hypothetical protein
MRESQLAKATHSNKPAHPRTPTLKKAHLSTASALSAWLARMYTCRRLLSHRRRKLPPFIAGAAPDAHLGSSTTWGLRV